MRITAGYFIYGIYFNVGISISLLSGLVFISPELLLSKAFYKDIIIIDIFRRRLVVFIINKLYYIKN